MNTDSPDDLCLFEPASSSKRLTGRVPSVHGFSLPIDPFGSCAPVDQRNIHHSGISLVHLVSAVPANKVNKVNPAGEDDPTVVCQPLCQAVGSTWLIMTPFTQSKRSVFITNTSVNPVNNTNGCQASQSSLPSFARPSPHRNDINPRRTPAPKRHRFQGAGQTDATLRTLEQCWTPCTVP